MKRMMLVPEQDFHQPSSKPTEQASRVELFNTDRNVLKQVSSLDIIEQILKLANISDEIKMKMIDSALSGFIVGKEQSKGANTETTSGKPALNQTVGEQISSPRSRSKRSVAGRFLGSPLSTSLSSSEYNDSGDASSTTKLSGRPNRRRQFYQELPTAPAQSATDSEQPPSTRLYPVLPKPSRLYPVLPSSESDIDSFYETVLRTLKDDGVKWNTKGEILDGNKIIPESNINEIVRMSSKGSPPAGLKEIVDTIENHLSKLTRLQDESDVQFNHRIAAKRKDLEPVKALLLKKQKGGRPDSIKSWQILRK